MAPKIPRVTEPQVSIATKGACYIECRECGDVDLFEDANSCMYILLET